MKQCLTLFGVVLTTAALTPAAFAGHYGKFIQPYQDPVVAQCDSNANTQHPTDEQADPEKDNMGIQGFKPTRAVTQDFKWIEAFPGEDPTGYTPEQYVGASAHLVCTRSAASPLVASCQAFAESLPAVDPAVFTADCGNNLNPNQDVYTTGNRTIVLTGGAATRARFTVTGNSISAKASTNAHAVATGATASSSSYIEVSSSIEIPPQLEGGGGLEP